MTPTPSGPDGGTARAPAQRARSTGRRLTMEDVARSAGVHKSTVSRALEPSHPFFRTPTAARIREIAAESGYVLDTQAASLRTQRTRTLGVLVPRVADLVMALLYEHISSACESLDYQALVSTTGDRPEEQRRRASMLLGRRVDGLILATARVRDDYLDDLVRQGLPVVLALRRWKDHPAAVGDDALGGYLATTHLLELGHERIGVVAGPDHASSALGRRAGYERALREHGLRVPRSLVVPSAFSMEDGERVAARFFRSRNPPTAVFAVNDNAALGVLAAARQAGLRVPEDLSVVGYNDVPLAARLPVPLTTVAVPIPAIAAAAVDMVMRRLNGEAVGTEVFPPRLVVRASTAPVR